jgi:hypothetical protein
MKRTASFVGLGIVLGAVIGALTENVGLWVGMGIVFGSALGAVKTKKTVPPETSNPDMH